MRTARKVDFPVGRVLRKKEYDELRAHAYNSALYYVTNFGKNSSQIRSKLVGKGYFDGAVPVDDGFGEIFEADIISDVIETLEKQYLLDDYDYTLKYVKSNFSSGKGESKIRLELIHRGIEKEMIDEVFEELGSEAKFDAIKKSFDVFVNSSKYEKFEPGYCRKQKVSQYLLNKGFSYSEISDFFVEVSYDG